jgi:hypothetical protein
LSCTAQGGVRCQPARSTRSTTQESCNSWARMMTWPRTPRPRDGKVHTVLGGTLACTRRELRCVHALEDSHRSASGPAGFPAHSLASPLCRRQKPGQVGDGGASKRGVGGWPQCSRSLGRSGMPGSVAIGCVSVWRLVRRRRQTATPPLPGCQALLPNAGAGAPAYTPAGERYAEGTRPLSGQAGGA